MEFSGALLDGLGGMIFGGMCVLFRLTALMIIGFPLTYHRAVPMRVRVFLIVHLTFVMSAALGWPVVDPGPGAPFSWLLVLAPEILLGLALGLIVRMALWVAEGMAMVASFSVGLGFAMAIDPGTGVQTTAIGRIMGMVAVLVMLAMDIHLQVLAGLYASFTAFAPGAVPSMAPSGMAIASLGGEFLATSLRLASPVIATGMLIYLALAVVTRVASALNLFAVGFPLLIMGGLFGMGVSFPDLVMAFSESFSFLPERMMTFLVSGQVR